MYYSIFRLLFLFVRSSCNHDDPCCYQMGEVQKKQTMVVAVVWVWLSFCGWVSFYFLFVWFGRRMVGTTTIDLFRHCDFVVVVQSAALGIDDQDENEIL